VNRSNHTLTISAPGLFSLLVATGTRAGVSAYGMMGFTGSNKTGAITYTGGSQSGSSYTPQFLLQDYIDPQDFQEPVDGIVNETGSGYIETVTFGLRKYMECNIRYATNRSMPEVGVFRNNPAGLTDLRDFMQAVVLRSPIEFEPDLATPATFSTFRLESTPSHKDGLGYKLTELISERLPGFFETGVLRWRLIE
jgi:hypothetical protein